MDDFLATIASRALGHRQSLLPRKASRFEPEAIEPILDLPAGSLSDTEPEASPSSPKAVPDMGDQPPEARQDTRRHDARRHDARMEEFATGPVQPRNREAVAGIDHQSQGPIARDARDERAANVPERSRPAAAAHRGNVSVSMSSAPRGQEIVEAKSLIEPDAPRGSRAGPIRAISTPGTGDVPDDAHLVSDSVVLNPIDPTWERDASHDEGTGEAERPMPRHLSSIAVHEDRESAIQDGGEHSPAPRIIVSIGRVVVHAPSPAPPARPPAPPARPVPQLTLGEYLERARRVRR